MFCSLSRGIAPFALVASLASPALAEDPKPGPRAPVAPPAIATTSTTTRLLNPGLMAAGVAMVAGGLAGSIVGGYVLSIEDGSDSRMEVGGALIGVGAGFVLIGTALAVVGGLPVKNAVASAGLRIEPRVGGLALRF